MMLLIFLLALQGNTKSELSELSDLSGLAGVLSLLPCRTLELVGDLENCHIFYQCDINPQPRSCGDMLFNTLSQVRFPLRLQAGLLSFISEIKFENHYGTDTSSLMPYRHSSRHQMGFGTKCPLLALRCVVMAKYSKVPPIRAEYL